MAADRAGKFAVAVRLARLPLEAVDLGVDLLENVLDAGEIVFGALEPELGFVPARVEAGDAGGLLEDQPARLGLGGNDLADLALSHQRRRARAGRSVGEQELHIACAHLLAIDAVSRTGVAFDAPGDLDGLGIIESGRRATVGIVEQEPNLGVVSGGTPAGAGEDDVLHARAAHVLERALAHHPAQSFDEVRLAATVRPDDAGQSRLDSELSVVAKALEASQAQALELHSSRPFDPARRSCLRCSYREFAGANHFREASPRFSGHIRVAQSTPAIDKSVRNRGIPPSVNAAELVANGSHLRPIRRERTRSPPLGPCLPVAAHPILERAELLEPDRPAGVHAPGGDADLGAEAELSAVGELGRGVVQDDRRIDLLQEPLGHGPVLGHNAVGVMRAVGLDVVDRRIETVDDANGDDRVEIFGAPVLPRRRRNPPIGGARRSVAAHGAAGVEKHRSAGASGWPRRRDTPAASRPRRKRRCAAAWR